MFVEHRGVWDFRELRWCRGNGVLIAVSWLVRDEAWVNAYLPIFELAQLPSRRAIRKGVRKGVKDVC